MAKNIKRVAIQGVSGCFHDEAATLFYEELGYEVRIVPCSTFEQIYVEMANGNADAAVMAIENTSSGGLIPNFELLRKSGKQIKGEVFLHISQNLLVNPGTKLEDLKEVRTHFMAINQTREFFAQYPWIELVESENTAKSAAEVAEGKFRYVGAVASLHAAQKYGLEVLVPSIETYKMNYTRFLVMDDSLEIPMEKVNKASLCFALPHKTGSLAHILSFLSFYDMNLTRIQSLPIPGMQWQYFFYADITFESYERYKQAISAVRPLLADLQILGEYHTSSDTTVL